MNEKNLHHRKQYVYLQKKELQCHKRMLKEFLNSLLPS